MRTPWMLLLVWVSGCAGKQMKVAYDPSAPLDAVIIPGCPTQPDGALSDCNWQRAIWGAKVWEDGLTRHFITSGSAVYNRYIESEALKAGLVELGVPADAILLETQALHTDENAGYALAIARDQGFETLGVASHGGQAVGMRAFLRGWGQPTEALSMDMDYVRNQPRPEVSVEPVPENAWLPLRQREKVLAERLDRSRRASSLWVYTGGALAKRLSGKFEPPTPPTPEPTLRGLRYRDDVAPW